MEKAVLALDLGASSGRAVIGKYKSGAFELTEIHRFYHKPIMKENTLYWDIDFIFSEIKKAIKLATSTTKIDSLAIDTWGVDYGLLDDAGFLIEAPTHYRDKKTEGIMPKITKLIPEEELYQITGIQLMEINTLFQLKADELNALEKFSKAKTMLLISDLLNYLLTGKKKTEMSIASTTGLLDPVTKNWNEELISRLKIPRELFTDIASEGQSLGFIKEELDLPPILVYHVCAHDTASAFASSASLEDCLFVSCGTWSLIGTERVAPIINEKSKKYNLTNESGIDRTTRLLKNTTGLWIIQELKREYGVSMLFSYLLTNTAQIFADVRTFWSPESVERVTNHKLTGVAKHGILHLVNSGSATLDGTGIHEKDGKPVIKPFWEVTDIEQEEILKHTEFRPANREYFRGGGFSTDFLTKGGMPITMSRLNMVKGFGPVLQIAEGYTVDLPSNVHDILDKRTDPTWPTTWFAPIITGEGSFKDAYTVMNDWGANHGSISYGHIGADLITLASMLRIPVNMHNVPKHKIFRPKSWGLFGTEELESADFRACQIYGPLYK